MSVKFAICGYRCVACAVIIYFLTHISERWENMDTRANFSVTVVLGWVFFLVCNPAVAATYSGGSGTEADPYRIATAEDMQAIGANKGDWDKHFVLTADIDLSCYTGTEFNIIAYPRGHFAGVFDGNEHTIYNFSYTTSEGSGIGLFACVGGASALIKDLTLVTPDVNATGNSWRVGGLVGCLENGTITGCGIKGGSVRSVTGYGETGGLVGGNYSGTISNCYAKGSVSGTANVGGLVGSNGNGTISDSYAEGTITGTHFIGGLVGESSYGTISRCYAKGSVSGDYDTGGLVGNSQKGRISDSYAEGNVTGDSETGGLVGFNGGMISNCHAAGNIKGNDRTAGLVGENHYGTIENCYAEGNVTGYYKTGGLVGWNDNTMISNSYAEGTVTGYHATGGLVGWHDGGTISNCYSSTSVSGDDSTGGLVGENYGGTIENCYAAGSVTGDDRTGGLVGSNGGTISNCYAEGSVTGRSPTGGLVGDNYMGVISNSYASGAVSVTANVGGLVGGNYEGTISGSFWDVNSSGMDISDGGEGKTTPQMQMQSTFTDAGWDFYMPVWKICEAVDYPRLEWEMIDWPIIDQEPDMTTGTSNTITWQQVDEAIEYYVICCSDANLENVVAESGWVDVNEYTFDNLETPQTYWYAVKARQNCVLESDWSDVVSSLQGTLGDAVDVMLDTDSLKNSNMKNALMNKIEQVLEMIDAGLYEDALKKLENDILKKTDGCIKTGQPDKNDWIKTCEAQQQIYPFVIETIDYVNSLMQ